MRKTALIILPMLVLFSSIGLSGTSPATTHGASLYAKHCAGCHRSVGKFKQSPDFVGLIRNPPSPMPAFGPDKLTDSQAKAISDYIRFTLSLKKMC